MEESKALMIVDRLVEINEQTPLADSRTVAKELGIDHESFFKMITQYQNEVEKDFGLIRFDIGKTTNDKRGRGRPSRYALLTEEQVYVYLAYSQNTEQARRCKRNLVKAFIKAREMLQTYLYAPQAELEGLTIHQIRAIGISGQIIALMEAGADTDLLITRLIAELQAVIEEKQAYLQISKR